MATDGELDVLYIFDSSAWIAADGWPTSNRITAILETLLTSRNIKSPPQVFDELVRAGTYSGWAKANRRRITYPARMSADYAANAGFVQFTFPGMGGALSRKEKADPWVISAALTEEASGRPCCIITTETAANRPNRKIKGACDQLGLSCKTLAELVESFPDEDPPRPSRSEDREDTSPQA